MHYKIHKSKTDSLKSFVDALSSQKFFYEHVAGSIFTFSYEEYFGFICVGQSEAAKNTDFDYIVSINLFKHKDPDYNKNCIEDLLRVVPIPLKNIIIFNIDLFTNPTWSFRG